MVGKNGAGKTTLLKLFAGKQPPTSGRMSMPKDITIGYLPQHLLVHDQHTLMEEVQSAFADINKLEKQIERLTQELSERTDYESQEYHDLIEKLSHENERLLLMGGNNRIAEAEKTLIGLGFKRTDFDRQTSEFSGGWRMRIELAKLLIQHPDLLLLDEPTNHLDIESIQWLENFLKTSSSAVILVSHDRTFLDAVTTRTIEITLGTIYDYKVNYSHYIQLRKERREQQQRAFENQQKQIADTEDFIERFRYKATKSVQVQSRIKQLEKLERIEVDEEDNSQLHLKFPPAPHSGVLPVEIENLEKSYGDHLVIGNVNMHIRRGDKVAFVGRNGEGKSTLVKCIMEQIPYNGTLKLGHGVKIGYFAQNQASLLDENKTVFDTIDYVAVGDIRTKIRDILGAFMFGGDASEKPVKVLSGGERSRLAMIQLLLEPVNLLILDEPTNHLDMRSKDVLKEAIKAFDGTVILVSHDRDFLDGLVDKVYEFGNQQVKEHLGGITEFLEYKRMDNLKEIERAQTEKKELNKVSIGNDESKNNYEWRKEQNKKLRKVEKQVEEEEKKIEKLETEIANLEEEFSNGNTTTESLTLYEKSKAELNEHLTLWESLQEEIEELQSTLI